MKLGSEDQIEDFIPGRYLKFFEKEEYYKTVNIYKFSREFCKNTYVPFLSAYEQAMGENEYYESVLKLIAMSFDGFSFERNAYKMMNISYVANRAVYVNSDVRRATYHLTDDGYDLLLGTLEMENNMKLTIHAS